MPSTNHQPFVADTSSGHVTPADGNVFADLGFDPEQAQVLLTRADALIAQENETSRLLAELLESATDLHEHGVIGAQVLGQFLEAIAEGEMRTKVLARLPGRVRATLVGLGHL